MQPRQEIQVNASRGAYKVLIGRGILQEELPRAVAGTGASRAAVFADSNVAPLHLGHILELLPDAAAHVFPAGESSKNLGTISELLGFLAENQFTRKDIVIALGGGVTGDMAGFTAAVYLRGIRFIQVPTTMLAAIDSSVGGKTGVDLPQGKNLVGAFWQPTAVLCDTALLDTLPERILFDGMAEAVKYGVIRDEALFGMLDSDGCLDGHLQEVVAQCVRIKAEIVSQDEFDRGDRALLNFGHTVGHAVEARSGFAISHGEGVAIGMVAMTRIAEARGWCASGTSERLVHALKRYRLPTELPFGWKELADIMLHDKKRSGDAITIVVPECIGRCVRREIPVKMLSEGLMTR